MKYEPDKKISATLHRLSQIQPKDGLEERVLTRLDRESARMQNSPAIQLRKFFLAQRLIFSTVAMLTGCAVIVAGSVQHSRRKALEGAMPAAGIHLTAPEGGVGAASGARISPQPIVAPENSHARSERKATNGRATIQKDTHKPSGVAVPESMAPKP